MTTLKNYLLSINIPTYKRLYEFSRLINSIYCELGLLDETERVRIIVRIFENPSIVSTEKYLILSQIKELGVTVQWHRNPINIGGDANIEKAYSFSHHTMYQWVIGDDEYLECNSMRRIYNLLNGSNDIGIVILRDTIYPIHRRLLDKGAWASYFEFAKDCEIYQPHLLIAHTLISSNIIKAGHFDATISNHYRNTIRKRIKTPFSFAHMKGIVSTLSKCENLRTILLDQHIINTTSRAPSLDSTENHEMHIQRLYMNYVLWLSHEFGIDHVKVLKSISSRSSLKLPTYIIKKVYHTLKELFLAIVQHLSHFYRKR